MPRSGPRWFLATMLLIALQGLIGCSPNDSGTIDLKKNAELSPSNGVQPREFRPGDLEER